MPKSSMPPGRLERTNAAWKNIVALRKKYSFPDFKSVEEINSNWHVSHDIPHDALNVLRRDAAIVLDSFGFMPWRQLPKG